MSASISITSWRPWSIGLVLVFLASISMLTPGCRSAPVRDMGPTSIPSTSPERVNKTIHIAGASLGWVMKEQSPGLIVATLTLRDHLAVVEIPYSATSFSIRYKDSQNLRYNADDRSIHSNYNGWVQNLNNAILAGLSVP
ncbi:MAG: hypothetical protein KAX46_05485 [Chromatiaceae bacterium]|nr:hypothetical protein [Chromatiaceae bacterium]